MNIAWDFLKIAFIINHLDIRLRTDNARNAGVARNSSQAYPKGHVGWESKTKGK